MISLKRVYYSVKVLVYFLIIGSGTLVMAQCPTVNNSAPLICDASGYTFSDLSTFVTDLGNGIVWYDAATGGTPFAPNELVLEGTYYAGDSTGTCGSRDLITVDFVVDPSGQNLDGIFCSNENPTVQSYIDEVLTPNIPVGGSVNVYEDFELTTLAVNTDLLNTTDIYYIVFIDAGSCESQIEIGNIATFPSPDDPTPPNPQDLCASGSPTIADLDPGTTDPFFWYDNIDVNGNPVIPALDPSTPLIDGNTYYVQADDFFCTSNAIPVLVTINIPPEPGSSASLDYCDDSIPPADFDLFAELSGSPETTGTWTGPLPTTNGHLGTVNISGLTAGVYTFSYSVPSTGACPDGSSSVTITIHEEFLSGTPSAENPASYCESTVPASFDLFSLLEGQDPGGLWTQGTSSADPAVTSPIDLTGFTSGTYDFTYTQNLSPNPCPENATTVQVTVLPDPNAGVAINAVFCENDLAANSPFSLFDALDGSQDNNLGTWTDIDGNVVTSPIVITTFTVAGSPYSYTYTIDNGSCTDMETITITIEDPSEAGTATPFEVCEEEAASNSPLDLFTLLTGNDAGGSWTDDDASGALSGSNVDLTVLAPNSYNFTYTVLGIGSCADDTETVVITINPQPITGTPTAFVVCEEDAATNSPLDLFGQLTGNDAGGTWSDDNGTGALSGSNVDLTSLAVGSYAFTYSITSTNGCMNSSTVIITIEDPSEAGTATPYAVCLQDVSGSPTLDLFTQLTGNDAGGTWADDDASGALSGSLVDLTLLATNTPYIFSYSVIGIGSCSDDTESVVVTINETPTPTATPDQDFCDSATVADLVATGTTIQWYEDATGGSPLADTTDLIDGENYFATQTDPATGCESPIRFEVAVTINNTPVSGNATAPIDACSDNSNIDLNTGLDGTQDAGGSWIDTDGTGALTGNIFDATGIAPSTYDFTYFVAGIPPCVDASTVVTVSIEDPVNAGTDAALDICDDTGTYDLFALLGGADAGGTWSPALASGTNIFDPLVDTDGTYTYSLSNACSNDSSDVVITVTEAPDAGTDSSVAFCVGDGELNLISVLGGLPDDSGTWSPALASGTNMFDPAIDTAGVYTYTVLATSPCATDASAQVTVSINDSSAPVVVQSQLVFCLENSPIVSDLDVAVSGTSLIWYEDDTAETPLDANDLLIDSEDYFATQTDGSGCESSVRVEVNVTINDAATPTLSNSDLELCINDNPTVQILTDNINEFNSSTNNIVWYDAETGGNIVSSSDLLEGNTTYYASLIDQGNGCQSSTRLAVTPDLTSCGTVVFPDGFSPNNDGVNDTYDVDNLGFLYPNFNMEIYNRYGSLVYKGGASTPRFNGKSNQSGLLSNGDLPVGVYFYIVNFNDGVTKPKQGRLYLNR